MVAGSSFLEAYAELSARGVEATAKGMKQIADGAKLSLGQVDRLSKGLDMLSMKSNMLARHGGRQSFGEQFAGLAKAEDDMRRLTQESGAFGESMGVARTEVEKTTRAFGPFKLGAKELFKGLLGIGGTLAVMHKVYEVSKQITAAWLEAGQAGLSVGDSVEHVLDRLSGGLFADSMVDRIAAERALGTQTRGATAAAKSRMSGERSNRLGLLDDRSALQKAFDEVSAARRSEDEIGNMRNRAKLMEDSAKHFTGGGISGQSRDSILAEVADIRAKVAEAEAIEEDFQKLQAALEAEEDAFWANAQAARDAEEQQRKVTEAMEEEAKRREEAIAAKEAEIDWLEREHAEFAKALEAQGRLTEQLDELNLREGERKAAKEGTVAFMGAEEFARAIQGGANSVDQQALQVAREQKRLLEQIAEQRAIVDKANPQAVWAP